ncbi:DNA mismatch repair endonuclease MutL [Bacillus sp. SM2101]|uniref:DNA mismatch repair endonuclease MutL n=1 Tax=Bacillus sp. SM2101 TaxID=2805366 RepID=UPI001BDDD84F
MGKIIELDDQLANKIAAGEVVERPASVVKELVENAIDAHSTVIEIELEEAGLAKIRVIDNGDGIEPDDCLVAFSRHATSKIIDENDLFRIRTLGFRGEALPSIASVSELEMKTSTGEEAGTYISIKGGELASHQRTDSRKGTDITVSNLFYNTPARLKYMKTINTELGNITDIVNRLALAYPSISFKLIHNGKKLLLTNGNGNLKQVIAAIYGVSIAKKMIPISIQSLDFEVKGFISLPELTRASRNYISTMINGRYIKNYSIVKAIQNGYHTLLPIGRYPIIVLEINMDPLLIDVNVHPSKLEVRLSKESELNDLIGAQIEKEFKTKQLIPEANPFTKRTERTVQQDFTLEHHALSNDTHGEPVLPVEKKTGIHSQSENVVNVIKENEDEFMHDEISAYHASLEPERIQLDNDNDVSEIEEEKLTDLEDFVADHTQRVPPLYPIGQMHGTYILAQNEQGLYIIDQHAAQERIKYEYYREKVGQVTSEVQQLLLPLTLEYSQDEYVLINEHKEELAQCGVLLEPFGHHCFIVRSHPTWFPVGDETTIIEDMIEQVLQMQKVDVKKLREEAAIMMSCKASIKANQHLKEEEIFSLLEQLRQSSDPFTCPHGRPIIIHYTTYEMEKMFKRVM